MRVYQFVVPGVGTETGRGVDVGYVCSTSSSFSVCLPVEECGPRKSPSSWVSVGSGVRTGRKGKGVDSRLVERGKVHGNGR